MGVFRKTGEYAKLIAWHRCPHRRGIVTIGHFLMAGAAVTAVAGSPVGAVAAGALALAAYCNRLEENAPVFDEIVRERCSSSFDTAYYRPLTQAIAAALGAPIVAVVLKEGITSSDPHASTMVIAGILGASVMAAGIHMGIEDGGGIKNFFRRQPRTVPVWMPPYEIK